MDSNNLSPRISVIMPVYNVGQFVAEAIRSILSQTEENFELIIIDDASTDNTYESVRKLIEIDSRIQLYQNPFHIGVAATANRCIAKSSGTFLARMDGDDVALPDRLAKQKQFLKDNEDVIAVGGQFLIIDEKGYNKGQRFFPTEHADIYRQTFTFTALSQPGMMINKSLLPDDFTFYNERLSTAEETELVFTLFNYGRVANLPDTILKYRMHRDSTSLKHPKKTFFITLLSRLKAVILGTYSPTLLGICTNVLQTLVITFLPSELILALYTRMRNHNKTELPSMAVRVS